MSRFSLEQSTKIIWIWKTVKLSLISIAIKVGAIKEKVAKWILNYKKQVRSLIKLSWFEQQ